MDDFKRAQFGHGHGNYCNCCDVHPDKCKNAQEMRGRVRSRMKRQLKKEMKAEQKAVAAELKELIRQVIEASDW